VRVPAVAGIVSRACNILRGASVASSAMVIVGAGGFAGGLRGAANVELLRRATRIRARRRLANSFIHELLSLDQRQTHDYNSGEVVASREGKCQPLNRRPSRGGRPHQPSGRSSEHGAGRRVSLGCPRIWALRRPGVTNLFCYDACVTSHSHRGKFITIEGLDGCGKSTQLERLAKVL